MNTFIISVANPTAKLGINPGCTDYQHSKFVKRRQYVEQKLLPQMQRLTSASIFDAVTDEDFKVVEGGVVHLRQMFKVNAGNTGNFLSHVTLWFLCAVTNQQTLILEDDAELPDENQKNVLFAAEEFRFYSRPAVLHLLSAIPSLEHGTKQFSDYEPVSYAAGLLRLRSVHDLSGTAAYAINPAGAKVLTDVAIRDGTLPTDGFIHRAFERREIDVLVPATHQRCFMLYEHFADWNHTHKGVQ
jgi:GR25 family glycosyltransferase involved in LPS biosynthesis